MLITRLGGRLRKPRHSEARPQRYHGLGECARFAGHTETVLQTPVPLYERSGDTVVERSRSFHGAYAVRAPFGFERVWQNDHVMRRDRVSIHMPARTDRARPPPLLIGESREQQLVGAVLIEPCARDRACRRQHYVEPERYAVSTLSRKRNECRQKKHVYGSFHIA